MEIEVTKEQIISEYFNLNPVGMPELTISAVRKKLKNPNEFLIDGLPFNLPGLVIKYKKYIDWHRKKFGLDEKFVKTADKLCSPDEFVEMNRFYNSFGMAKGKREYYLFGEFTENELREKLRSFLSKYDITLDTPRKSIHAQISSSYEETNTPKQGFDITEPDF